MSWLKGVLGFVNWSGTWKWWLAGAALILALIGTILFLQRQNDNLRAELVVAKERQEVAATQLLAKDNLLSTLVKTESQSWTTAEEKCLAQIKSAYDAGVGASTGSAPGGVSRSVRERQAGGAFGGSVSAEGSG